MGMPKNIQRKKKDIGKEMSEVQKISPACIATDIPL
jgi:hypothetical protein